ncbi:MAG: DinB family protein [Terracidiphilus sp.]|jgi:uncharacterized damage-inducible protein DinB
MAQIIDSELIDAILDSWDRNNRILVNLLRALPPGGKDARVMATSPSVSEIFAHLIYVRLIFVSEDAPEWAGLLDPHNWIRETDSDRLAYGLESSAHAVRDAVEDCLRSGKPMRQHYDHPLLFLQHMIWHEGYHHGQIKLALKVAGQPFDDKRIGPLTWGVWMRKTGGV